MRNPWLIGGDFNVVVNGEKKIGGLPVDFAEVDDFKSCDLTQVSFKGSPFTRWNGRAGDDCMFERMDRILSNSEFLDMFSHIEVEHLPRLGSDHTPLLLSCEFVAAKTKRPFRFLKFWTEHELFKDVIRMNWDTKCSSNPFLDFKRKIKQIKKALSLWSRETYGDIFQQLIIREEIERIKEKLFEELPSGENRTIMQREKAEYNKYLHLKESYWQQKVGYEW